MSQKDTKVWEVNGIALPLDLEDAAVMARYEEAFARFAQGEKQVQKDGKLSERIKAYCLLYHALYDDIFGEGTAAQLFGERLNAAECDAVYESFLNFVRAQMTGMSQRRADTLRKYQPNRAAKRAAKKK